MRLHSPFSRLIPLLGFFIVGVSTMAVASTLTALPTGPPNAEQNLSSLSAPELVQAINRFEAAWNAFDAGRPVYRLFGRIAQRLDKRIVVLGRSVSRSPDLRMPGIHFMEDACLVVMNPDDGMLGPDYYESESKYYVGETTVTTPRGDTVVCSTFGDPPADVMRTIRTLRAPIEAAREELERRLLPEKTLVAELGQRLRTLDGLLEINERDRGSAIDRIASDPTNGAMPAADWRRLREQWFVQAKEREVVKHQLANVEARIVAIRKGTAVPPVMQTTVLPEAETLRRAQAAFRDRALEMVRDLLARRNQSLKEAADRANGERNTAARDLEKAIRYKQPYYERAARAKLNALDATPAIDPKLTAEIGGITSALAVLEGRAPAPASLPSPTPAAASRGVAELASPQDDKARTRDQRTASVTDKGAPVDVAPPDVWLDSSTRLMWPRRDNGRDVTWSQADRFCRALRAGRFDDWRLPTMDELQALYMVGGGSVVKTGWWIWSSEKIDASSARTFYFTSGDRDSSSLERSGNIRVLCVRP